MRNAFRRALMAMGAGVLALGALAAPAPAQQTTQTTITYAGESASAGLYLAITAPGESEPAAAIAGAAVEGMFTSDGPAASGSADALALLGETPVHAESSAPPDSSDDATSPIPAITVPDVATIGVLQGEASSSSEAEDGLPSTQNTASFSGVDIEVGVLDLGPLGTVAGDVTVLGTETFANGEANTDTDVGASAASSGIAVSADVDVSLLSEVCANLPPGPLQDACNSVAQQEGPTILEVSLGDSEATCAWDGESADCDGFGALAVIELLGQEPITVAPGETVTIPEDGPFLVRASAGTFSKEVSQDPDSASAIATGVSLELLGADPALPGLITIQLGQSTAAVSGDVETEQIIPRTGGPVVPMLLGGAALAAGGLTLRRYLRRR